MMNSSILVVVFVHLCWFSLSLCQETVCIESERETLLKLKHNLKDPLNRLSSWNASVNPNCCQWVGVVCNYLTSHIEELYLSTKHPPCWDVNNKIYFSEKPLQGTIPDVWGNMTSLVRLDLSCNQLEGLIPTSLGNMTSLSVLDLSYNQLEGSIPTSLGNVASSLVTLDVSKNKLKGNPFESLRPLYELSYLDIGDNHFEGVVTEDHLSNLTSLNWFYASGNNFTLKVGLKWNPTFQLTYLDMSFWKLGPNFPSWIHSQNILDYLAMSNTGISDSIPSWFWKTFSDEISFLNLSHNYIHGNLTSMIPISMGAIDLSANNLCGPLPSLSFGRNYLDLSSNSFSNSMENFLCNNSNVDKMWFLNLANNNLSGKIPDCWLFWPSLVYINLQSNNFVGNLPSSMAYLEAMQFLQIRNNSLSGTFPTSLMKNDKLILLDLRENKLLGTIPKWVGKKFLNMRILCLSSNNFSGHIPNEICDMSLVQVLDLAQNNLSGSIPTCFSNFGAMTLINRSTDSIINYSSHVIIDAYDYGTLSMSLLLKGRIDEYKNILGLVTSIDLSNNQLVGEIPIEITYLNGLIFLNLSHNQLIGHIPRSIGNMRSLLSIDFSRNKLSGEIPSTISNLSFLSMIDLSYNHLKGKIPTGTQLQTFDASNFIGNHLCDPPLPINCSSNAKVDHFHNNERGSDRHGVNSFFVSMTFGFVVGFWIIVGPLFISRSWRYTYFHFFEHVWFKFHSLFLRKYAI